MTASKILIREDTAPPGDVPPAPDAAWYLMGGIGIVFLIVAGVDLALAWYPADFGNTEWEFGTVTTTLGSFPLFTTAWVFLLGAAVARGSRLQVQVVSGFLGLVALLLIVVGVLFAKAIPAALNSSTDPTILLGLQRAIARTSGQAILYPVGFAWLAWKGWRHSSSR